jgi:hypothetical protein
MHDASKRVEVVDRRILAVLSLEWSPAVEGARRCHVEDVDSCRHGLAPEVARKCLRFEHASCHCHHALVSPFHHPILLRGIQGGKLAIHSALSVVLAELHEFATTISVQHLQFLHDLDLDDDLEVSDMC